MEGSNMRMLALAALLLSAMASDAMAVEGAAL
jgi:hypothetical protein